MTIVLYSPYLSSGVIGGGEKHVLEFARVASKKHTISIALSADSEEGFADRVLKLRKQLDSFLGWSTDIFSFISTPLGTSAHFLTKLWWTQHCDYLYYVTDGSLFFSAARHNNVHIQIPFTHAKDSLIERLKLANWKVKNANSIFTKSIVETAWRTTVPFVLYPLVKVSEFAGTQKKEHCILSVGRFFRHLHSKRQDVLITAFRELLRTHPKQFAGWKLLLVGPNDDPSFTAELHKQALGLPIEFHHAVGRSELVELFKCSRIYWHAAGFEQDVQQHPEAVEHFGISIVEAMAAGAVPIVVGAGGPAEILTAELKQLLWHTVPECVAFTKQVVSNPKLESSLRAQCIARASDFSETHFERTVWQMIP